MGAEGDRVGAAGEVHQPVGRGLVAGAHVGEELPLGGAAVQPSELDLVVDATGVAKPDRDQAPRRVWALSAKR